MRTTLTLDDDLAATLKGDAIPKPKRYRLKPVSLGGSLPGVAFDKALDLADALEDHQLFGRQRFRRFAGIEHVNPLED